MFGYDTVKTNEESPVDIIRNLFSGTESNRWQALENPSSPKILSMSELKEPTKDFASNFYDEATPSYELKTDTPSSELATPTQSIDEYKTAKQEMQRLGFEDMDEYFDYLDYMQKKQNRTSKRSDMEM